MSETNGVMMQYFHWYLPNDGDLWWQVKAETCELADAGFTSLWLPPAYKGAAGGYDVGYGVYDLFDLGEFDQKDSVRTKYGTKEDYLQAIQAAKQQGLRIYADVVFNHKMGGTMKKKPKPCLLALITAGMRQEIFKQSKPGCTLSFLVATNSILSLSGIGGTLRL